MNVDLFLYVQAPASPTVCSDLSQMTSIYKVNKYAIKIFPDYELF